MVLLLTNGRIAMLRYVSAAQLYQHVSAYSGISSCHVLPSQLLAAVAHRQSACAAAASPLRQCAGEAPALLVALGLEMAK